MKKILALAIALNLLNSCVTEAPIWERTYQIKNNTENNIILRVYEYYPSNGESFEDIILQNGEVFIGSKTGGPSFSNPYSNPDNLRPASSFNSFELVIVYNNEKKMIYSRIDSDGDDIPDSFSEPINRHLLRGGNYTDIGNDIYEIVLTQEDYNNATPCNGDCLD